MTDEVHDEELQKLQRAVKSLANAREDLRCVHADMDLNVLKHAAVVGMTTNGVASKQELVAAMAPKVPAGCCSMMITTNNSANLPCVCLQWQEVPLQWLSPDHY